MMPRWPATPLGAGWAELVEAQRFRLRLAASRIHGLSVKAESRPGGRPTFLWQQESRQRSAPRFNAARFAHGPLRCSKHRVAAQLALAALGARTVLATAALRASEPDASVLLGVSEGEGKASAIGRCRVHVAWMQAEGRNLGTKRERRAGAPKCRLLHPDYDQPARVDRPTVLTFGSRRERRVAERDREEGRGLSELRAQRGRVPQAPGRASNAGKSDAQRLTANAGCPSLWFLSLAQARERYPAAGTDSRPNHFCKPATRARTATDKQ